MKNFWKDVHCKVGECKWKFGLVFHLSLFFKSESWRKMENNGQLADRCRPCFTRREADAPFIFTAAGTHARPPGIFHWPRNEKKKKKEKEKLKINKQTVESDFQK